MKQQRRESSTRGYHRTGLDYFGIVMMFVLVACSLAIFARLMATKMLTTTNLIIAMVVLLVLNGLHIFVQLPLRRNKTGKLICGILAVLLSAGMIYGTVAADAVQSALNKISGVVVEKQVTERGRGGGAGRHLGLHLRHPGQPRSGEHPEDRCRHKGRLGGHQDQGVRDPRGHGGRPL